ncbi:AhpD family alkylhydroperoxidase [Friedmanniella endophytica]|uniref:AhpD family alkylhydroperoxidase n=1 Tax=Microlunatus kandeliicorticis TaxID=1759536 RepID=A0A7W3IVL8_9ACTN|nr:carboxymuconolactone decarboxylase family protein [Microlunatus kandeliicorticis]MBA8796067.1 AhpD family alkylhydroperoxidase [Microlunatus kandeliicorticis]
MTTTDDPTRTTADRAERAADQAVEVPVRLEVDQLAASFLRAMGTLDAAATRELDRAGIDPGLRELVRVRASQLNGCAYCVDQHTRDAAAGGESAQRLNAVAVWRESPWFTARERAALALTESITRLSETHVPDRDHAAAAEHFAPPEEAALIALITTINAWNALSVATRAWTPVLGAA